MKRKYKDDPLNPVGAPFGRINFIKIGIIMLIYVIFIIFVIIIIKIGNILLKMNLLEIGKIIRERREFMKLNQDDLAEISGVAIKTIYAIELGKANPSVHTLIKLFTVLGLEINVQVIKS